MQNKISKFYKCLLYLSLFINTLIVSFGLFFIINIKFVIFETFFEKFYEFIDITCNHYFSFDILHDNKRNIFNYFVASLNYIDIFCYYIVFIIITGLIINLLFKKNFFKYLFSVILFSLTTYFAYLIFLFPLPYKFIILFFIIFLFFVLINYNSTIISRKINLFTKILLLIPILNIILLPSYTVKLLFNYKINKINKFLIFILPFITTTFCFTFFPYTNTLQALTTIAKKSNELIMEGTFYNINNDNGNILTSLQTELLLIKNNQIQSIFKSNDNIIFDIQTILFNNKKNEYYYYEHPNYKFYVLDGNNFNLKKEITFPIISENKNGLCERMVFDDTEQNIAIILENGPFYILDTDSFEIKDTQNLCFGNDSIVFNPYRKEFLMTFWNRYGKIPIYSLTNNKFQFINSYIFQGTLTLSKRNKELYLSLPQRGKIYVYDAETYKFKYKIKTLYMAKSLYYIEEKNILIVLSYNTGYIDIFLMNESHKLLKRQFIGGYRLRDAKLAQDNKTLYITSAFGLYKTSLEI